MVPHTLVLHQYYSLSLDIAIADSIFYNSLFAFLSIPVWYVLKYVAPTKQKNSSIFANHLTILTLLLLIWIFIANQTLKLFFSTNHTYFELLESSIPVRILIGVFYYLLTISIYYLIIYYNDLQDKLLEESRLKELVTLSELNMLKSQINPHFLFNSLNSISSLTLIAPSQAQEMIIKLSDFLRYTISHQTNQQISLNKELEIIKLYLDIEQVRFSNKLKLEWHINTPIYPVDIPTMLLQPIFENAIKHGVYDAINEITINTRGVNSDDFYIVTISNNFESEISYKKGSGLGLKNVSDRLRLNFEVDNLLTTSKSDSQFKVEIKIPYKKE